MSLLPALLMILSGSIHAVVNALIKGAGGRSMPAGEASRTSVAAGRAATDAVSALILLPALLVVPAPEHAWPFLIASSGIHAVYLYALVRAYDAADFSACYPVLRGTAPLATAAVSVGVLGEPVSAADLLGVALIGGSMVALVAGRHLSREGLAWSVATGIAIACYTVVDARGVRAAPSPASYIAWSFVLTGAFVPSLFLALHGRPLLAAARRQWRPGLLAGALSIVTYGLALTAFSMGPTASLAALRETGVVTAVLIGAVFLRERVTLPRAAAVAGVLAGAALILLG